MTLPENQNTRLNPAQYSSVRHLFAEPHLALVIEAVIAGHSPAHIWVDAATRPQTALLWDKSHGLYLAGALPSSLSWLHTLLHQTIIPEARGRGIRLFKVYHSGPDWAEIAPSLLNPIALTPRTRSFLRFDPSSPPVGDITVPDGFTLRPIDASLLADDNLMNIEALREEITSCWPMVDTFLFHGFGFCLVQGTELVCWCTAEYVSAGQCGVGIETIETYQGRGLATAAAHAFVAHCQEQNITAHWDSWQANTPSVAVARKIGFRHLLDYSVYLGFLS